MLKRSRFPFIAAMLILLLSACDSSAGVTPTSVPAAPTSARTSLPVGTPTQADISTQPSDNVSVRPNVLNGKTGTADDISPTPSQIELARLAIGGGFVGIIACTMGSEYHSSVANEAKARAEAIGLRAEIFDSQAKPETQVPAMQDFIKRGAKALALCVLDPKVVESAVWEAAGQGVAIVQYAGRESSANGVSVSIEDADLGCSAGEIAGDIIRKELDGKATVAILDYPPLKSIIVRAENIERCLKTHAPDARVLCCFLGATEENGKKSMEAALKQNPDINAVVSINDAGAYGAIEALKGVDKDPKTTIVVGIDGEARARQLIKEGGYYRGTVDTAPARTGETSINAVVALLANAPIPKSIIVPVTKITADEMP